MPDLDAQLRILEAAQGDPALLALAVVDLVHFSLPEPERARLREALLAAAVPHWFDPPFLAALLGTSPEEANLLHERLRALSNVEPFPARGPSACNVHEATRLPLREHLRLRHPDLWKTYSLRARQHVLSGAEAHRRIEALFHLFAVDQQEAAVEGEALDRELGDHPDTRAALCLALEELTEAGWLSGAALVEARLALLWQRYWRGEAAQLGPEAEAVLALAREHSHPSRVADAVCLVGDVHQARGDLDSAMISYSEHLRIFQDLAERDPGNAAWQRDLAVAHNRVGDIHQARGNREAALAAYSEGLRLSQELAARDPSNAGWQRDLAVAHSKVGDIHEARGNLEEALAAFSEYLRLSQELAERDPSNALWQCDLAVAHNRVGGIHQARGNLEEALAAFSETLRLSRELAERDPSNALWQRELAPALQRMGLVLRALGREAEARRRLQESAEQMAKALAMSPENAQWKRDLEIIQSCLP